jgi:hypothetical protein
MNTPDGPAKRANGNGRSGGGSMLVMLGTNIAVGMGVFTLIGFFVDKKRGAGHMFTIIGAVVGFLYAGYEVWKALKWLETVEMAEQTGKEGPGKSPKQ